jgi:hypothetical protein
LISRWIKVVDSPLPSFSFPNRNWTLTSQKSPENNCGDLTLIQLNYQRKWRR